MTHKSFHLYPAKKRLPLGSIKSATQPTNNHNDERPFELDKCSAKSLLESMELCTQRDQFER